MVSNESGSYRNILKQISNIQSMTYNAKSAFANTHFMSSMVAILDESNGNFAKLFSLLRNFIKTFEVEDRLYNVVWYGNYIDLAVGGGK